MKTNFKSTIGGLLLLTLPILSLFSGCKPEEDLRPYEDVKIVGVKIDGQLYLPVYDATSTFAILPAGYNLSDVKVQILIANGELVNFNNNSNHDMRYPIDITMKAYNGGEVTTKLRVQSPPKVVNFIIDGITPLRTSFGSKAILAQVAPGTDLTALKVTIEINNGTFEDFTNGEAYDYTNPRSINILGVDGETKYPYNLVVTTEDIGPAKIKSITIGSMTTDSVITNSNNEATPFFPGLIDYTNVTIALETGLNNVIDPNAKLTGLNLLAGNNKVKITGSDMQEIEFTIKAPRLSLTPLFNKTQTQLGFDANGMSSCAFSGEHVIINSHVGTNKGLAVFDFAGNFVKTLSLEESDIDNGNANKSIRKIASDDNGVVLGAQLSNAATGNTECYIYRWDNIDAKPTKYITFSQTGLGLAYSPRIGGINIQGSLTGNAKIVITIAKYQDIFVYTVTNGVLNTTPAKLAFPYAGSSYYYSVQPLPLGTEGYIGAATGNSFNGIVNLSSTGTDVLHQSGIVTTDCDVISHKNRTYLAYSVLKLNSGSVCRLVDITDGQEKSFNSYLMDDLIPSTEANTNNTMDADMTVINGNLYVVFSQTNMGTRLYKLEQ